jgi:hypothetical protein
MDQRKNYQRRARMTDAEWLGGHASNVLNSALLGAGDDVLGFVEAPYEEKMRALGLASGDTPIMDSEIARAEELRRRLWEERQNEAMLSGAAGLAVGPVQAGGRMMQRMVAQGSPSAFLAAPVAGPMAAMTYDTLEPGSIRERRPEFTRLNMQGAYPQMRALDMYAPPMGQNKASALAKYRGR